jgi:hypothetical protein
VSILRYMSSFIEEFWLAHIYPPLIAFSSPSARISICPRGQLQGLLAPRTTTLSISPTPYLAAPPPLALPSSEASPSCSEAPPDLLSPCVNRCSDGCPLHCPNRQRSHVRVMGLDGWAKSLTNARWKKGRGNRFGDGKAIDADEDSRAGGSAKGRCGGSVSPSPVGSLATWAPGWAALAGTSRPCGPSRF